MATTARFGLPFLAAGQAQKEIVHNEALALIDMMIQPIVLALGVNDPPVDPAAGNAWTVGDAPTGVWIGHTSAIAIWSAGGWRFISAADGMHVFVQSDGYWARFRGGGWESGVIDAAALKIGGVAVVGPQEAPISGPSGGGIVDNEARAAIDAMLAALRTHGLIST